MKKYALRDFYWFYLVSILKTHWRLQKAKIQEIKRRVFVVEQDRYVQQLTKKRFLFNPIYFEFLIYLNLYKQEGVYAFISEEGDILFDTKRESEDQKRFFGENPVLTISFEYLKQWVGTLPGITEKTKKLSEADKKIIHHFTQEQDSWIAKNTLVKQRKGYSSTRLVIAEYYLQENTTRQDIRELEIKRQTRHKVGEYEGKKAYILEYTERII